MKYHIERGTVQETLVIPLYARKVCMEKFPDLFADPACGALMERIDYDFAKNGKKVPLFGALEGGTRQYDLLCEVRAYLKDHPSACVVNLGCGLDTTFAQADNGTARGYNLDLPDVIALRGELLPPGARERNVPCDLNDTAWFDEIGFSPEEGAVFIAGGVFYYFTTGQMKALLPAMAKRFPGGAAAFDVTTPLGLKMMLKTWIRGADMDIGAYFSLRDTERELSAWSPDFSRVERRGYMTGYRPPDRRWGALNRWLSHLTDRVGLTQIAHVEFRRGEGCL